ncbi:nuclease [Sulfolobus virus Ragged Hills]|uniref:ORF D212 n=1 Tax=Sulfolobus virus Ragged Hills TaxID=256994 RepID=Q6TRV5_9VIRU|nr:nuclease [Sulfolobus virus Ragged Hills]AAR27906.1 ORF D212 [Sulfolobus virus Ragged Hills]2W8M_A Chain A, ORF D212 [Sulfolobus virus Ragged Hills]2W8M_B Chain B, ORF D212 [Sulfolobus virus Ragged Hills]
MTETDFKLKYWGNQEQDYILPTVGLGREYLVLGKLLISLSKWRAKGLIDFDVYLRPTGVGTLTNTINYEYYKGLEDKYDLTLYIRAKDSYYPLLWIDITGSSWTEEQSKERYGESIYAILSVKVETAKKYDVLGRVFFIHYNDTEDKLKCISALQILNLERQNKIKKDKFERGAKSEYYLIPTSYWKNLTELRIALRGFYQSFKEYLARSNK